MSGAAAGISGLRGRRHEAELRLRAADANLGRLDDAMAERGARLQALRRQAPRVGGTPRRYGSPAHPFRVPDRERASARA